MDPLLEIIIPPIVFVLSLYAGFLSIVTLPFTVAYFNFIDGHYIMSWFWIFGICIWVIIYNLNTQRIKRGLFKMTRYYYSQGRNNINIIIFIISSAIAIYNMYIFFSKYPFKKILFWSIGYDGD